MKTTEVAFLLQSVYLMEEVCLKMCRLMGYVSSKPETFAAAAGKNLPEFIELSSVHCDGWGISALDSRSNKPELSRAAETARDSKTFLEVLSKTNSDGALLHLRWATSGIPVGENNTHPFVFDGFTFIHNGAIYPKNALDDLIDSELKSKVQGDTDSERYFYFLLTQIRKLGMTEGIRSSVKKLRELDFSSINAMLLTDKYFITICEHDPKRKPDWAVDGYYDLYYKKTASDVVVASSGWDQNGWIEIPNHHMLQVDRTSLDIDVLTL